MFTTRNLPKLYQLSKYYPTYIAALHSSHSPLYAGHSKWANIRHTKAEKDGQKSAIFTKLSRQIRLAVQEGGSSNPERNSLLRTVLDEAHRKNMPVATIQSNIKKGENKQANLNKYLLEFRYKQKVFAVCIAYTDNIVGLKSEVASILRKFGSAYSDTRHMFDDFGLIEVSLKCTDLSETQLEEKATEDAIDVGAEEINVIGEQNIHFICSPIEIDSMRTALEGKGYTIENAEHIYAPKNVIDIAPDDLKIYEMFVKKLREVQGVEDIYDNIHIA